MRSTFLGKCEIQNDVKGDEEQKEEIYKSIYYIMLELVIIIIINEEIKGIQNTCGKF